MSGLQSLLDLSYLTGLGAGIGSFIVHMYGVCDANCDRKRLNKNAERVRRVDAQIGSLSPTVKAELAPSVSHHTDRSCKRALGAKLSIVGSLANLANAGLNTAISALQLANYKSETNEILAALKGRAYTVTSSLAGSIDVINGFIQGSTFVSAVKLYRSAKNPASKSMYKWHAINQGLQTIATWGRGASSFVSVASNYMVDLPRLGPVAPSIVGAVAAAILSMLSNKICKNRIEAARKGDPVSPAVCRTALETQVSSKHVEKYIKQYAAVTNPNDPVLAELNEEGPPKKSCWRKCCCSCSGKKQAKPEAAKGQELISIRIDEPALSPTIISPVDPVLHENGPGVTFSPSPVPSPMSPRGDGEGHFEGSK